MRDRPCVPATGPVPAAVARVAARRTTRAVWANEVGGLTFEIGHGLGRFFLKWTPIERAWELEAEAQRLRWAPPFTPLPAVIDEGGDDAGVWLATTPLPGENAVSPRWKAEPAVAVRSIGEGLRALHDALPVTACPFSWSAVTRLAMRAVGGQPANWIPPTGTRSTATSAATTPKSPCRGQPMM